MKNIYFLFLVFFCTSVNAQFYKSGSITDNNNQTIEGRLSINNSESKVYFKKDGSAQTYNFNSISQVSMSGRIYSKITFENNVYLAHSLVNGKASLSDLNNSDYLILMENGSGKIINLEEDKAQIPGILGVLFNDCNSIRDIIYKSDEINERLLKGIVSEYNTCAYGDYTPTEDEMKNANTYNTDTYRFYAAFQTQFTNTTVNGFESNSNTGYGIGIGMAASPGFTGNLQGNLYFDFDFSMNFTGDSQYNNGSTLLNYNVNTYRITIGLEYLFNKKGTIQPFLGVGYGFTSDHFDGKMGTISFKDKDQNGIFIPKVGLLYKLKNGNHLGLTLSYLTEYENDLSFRFGELITYYPFVVDTSAYNLGLNYYF